MHETHTPAGKLRRKLSALVALEFLVVIVVCILCLTNAPEGISTQTLQPNQFFTPGIGVLLAFGIAALMGFESGSIFAKETKGPARTVSRATYMAVIISSSFYAFASWALAMYGNRAQQNHRRIRHLRPRPYLCLAG